MIKYTGQSTCLARVYKEGESSYVDIVNPSDFIATEKDGQQVQYNPNKKLYLDSYISISEMLNDVTITACYYVDRAITKIMKGPKVIWELITSCFGTGFWKENANWVESETWKE